MGNIVKGGRQPSGSVGSLGSFGRWKRRSDDSFSSGSGQAEILEVKIALSKLPDKEVKEVPIGSHTVLVVRDGSEVRAFGSKCTHYGAPLIKGVYANGRIRCPWHGACFNLTTGDIEDFPGLDSLPCFSAVMNADDSVTVRAPKAALEKPKRVRRTVEYDGSAGSGGGDFVIVGSGGAGAACAENLRYNGYSGLVVVVTQDEFLPYDRPKLSKALQSKPEEIALRSGDFYEDLGIKMITRQTVLELNPDRKKLVLRNEQDGTKWDLDYGKLLVATGGKPRKLDVPGSDLKNVFYLRSLSDAGAIAQAGAGKRVVIIGSSFIGMEVAAYFCQGDKAESVTVVGAQSAPFETVLGRPVGARIQRLFEESSSRIQFIMDSAGVREFLASAEEAASASSLSSALDEAVLGRVVLSNGESLHADVCVVGIGAERGTYFLGRWGVELDARGYVYVDEKMRTNVDGVYAAGDIAKFPLKLFEKSDDKDKRVAIGHWGLAMKLGEVAAKSMCGSEDAGVRTVPFFWSVLFGKSLRYAGYAPNFDGTIVAGSLDELSFAVFYCRGDSVDAVATLNMDPVAAKFAEWRYAGRTLEASRLRPDPLAWTKESIDAA